MAIQQRDSRGGGNRDARTNRRIKAREVRAIGPEGEQLGVLPIEQALARAQELGMDLVEVSPMAKPPVCKIMDYGKFKYLEKKKQNEAKKKQVTITVKEVKFRPGTDDHDYDYRMKHAREWLKEGDKVKATIWFRGREMTHRELGSRILAKLEGDLQDIGEVEARPRMEGNQMFIIFGPKRHKGAAKPERPAGAPAERPVTERPVERQVAEPPAERAAPETSTSEVAGSQPE